MVLGRRLNMLLCSVYRGMFSEQSGGAGEGGAGGAGAVSGSEWVASQRAQYHALFSRYVKVRHRGVLKALEAGKLALASAAGGGYPHE